MRPLLLPAVIFFILWTILGINKARGRQEQSEKEFWDRERRANMTRRKSLDGLEYISIPRDSLPFDKALDDDIVKDCIDTINSIADDKIVNLTGYSNTDLKLMYGAPNINLLTRYDQAYLTLARTLQLWADRLLELGFRDEAKAVLEFSVSTDTDVTAAYSILKDMYLEDNEPDKITDLIDRAQGLNSMTKPTILKILSE